ncbi:MAG: aminomethyl-transferring glycine dehydrogenase [Bacteroidetes bacterium]|nr:aminomethyl-transferring glycine dehydrogenase [Bacteroidota bacterium]MCY4205629.1 aminomethyl-transferring glycine dehydrogenase [Bacteroidota bacterium]
MSIKLPHADRFASRHIGPSKTDVQDMIEALGLSSLNELIQKTIPESILDNHPLNVPESRPEHVVISDLRTIGRRNKIFRSYIGMGYHDTITPRAILRSVLENPSWYTQYTPYQAEISQGRLEALLNFQTAVIDLTGMEIANASLLDEGTAAAEAMMMFFRLARKRTKFLVSSNCHPQTISLVKARSLPLGIDLVISDHTDFQFTPDVFGALIQYPGSDGVISNYESLCDEAHKNGAYVAVAADLLSLALLRAPGRFGADAVIGNSQRFGVPLGYGGPHAAFFATKNAFRRQVPGRMIGVTVDIEGKPALRMALQMREQHIKRARATSNICTAQVLLAVMAGAYAVFHGPKGIHNIALCVHMWTLALAKGLRKYGYHLRHQNFFDTICIENPPADLRKRAELKGVNLRYLPDGAVCISLNETTTEADVNVLLSLFITDQSSAGSLIASVPTSYEGILPRDTPYLTHPIFNQYRSETELMRYLHRLASRDLSLTTSMIPLGSCTMKLNAAVQLAAVSWADYNGLHPFIPLDQAIGYQEIFRNLEKWLGELTGFSAVSLQPNSGASGEYAGLLVIRAYLASKGEDHRNVCLVPDSAHGTNPASAVMAGMKVVVIRTLDNGDIDHQDLNNKLEQYGDHLAALMITYPTTYGVFEEQIREICALVHAHGGQVYMDGANMNAQVGLCKPGDFGTDVCHLNLHKTFAIPHGGGGPGVGPICVANHLAPFLPGHPVIPTGGEQGIGPISAAPYGSASILLISWAYIALLGPNGLRRASEIAILNANYLAYRLSEHYEILFRGRDGYVAHEFILDVRPLKRTAGIDAVDIAKRLMDYGYHAPTMSWPVAGTMMIEPTESESKAELDRFCEAMIAIRAEIAEIEEGKQDQERNILKLAPHTTALICADDYDLPYTRMQAAFPASWTRDHKFWPTVRRIDEAYGDRNLVCTCPPIEEYQS